MTSILSHSGKGKAKKIIKRPVVAQGWGRGTNR